MPDGISSESAWRRSRVTVAVPQPAAGADWLVTVPAGHIYRLLSVYGQLVSSAAVATRVPRLILTDGVRTLVDLPPGASQAASLTRRYAWLPSVGPVAVGNNVLGAIPDIILSTGWSLAALTDSIDVGDQWSNVVLNVIDTTTRDGADNFESLPDIIVQLISPPAP